MTKLDTIIEIGEDTEKWDKYTQKYIGELFTKYDDDPNGEKKTYMAENMMINEIQLTFAIMRARLRYENSNK